MDFGVLIDAFEEVVEIAVSPVTATIDAVTGLIIGQPTSETTTPPPTTPTTPGTTTPPVKPPTTTTTPPTKQPGVVKANSMGQQKFFLSYGRKSDEIFNDEKHSVPPLKAAAAAPKAAATKTTAAAAAPATTTRPKRDAANDELLPPWDDNFIIPPFNPDLQLTDAQGIKILHHLSVFDENNKNIVAENADKYFLENVLLYSDPNNEILELFGLTKPKLHQSRLDICDEPKVTLWYSYYSFYYLPLMVANGNYSVSKKINAALCKEKILDLETNQAYDNTYAHQRMLLFKYAYCEKNQWMIKFQKSAERWLPLFMNSLKSQDNLSNKVTKLNEERTTEQFQAYVVNTKATLDILDPTGAASRNFINQLVGSSLFISLDNKDAIKDNKVTRNIIKDTVERVIEQIQTPGVDLSEDQVTIGKDFINQLGSTAGACKELQQAILATQFESLEGPDINKGYVQYFEDIGKRVMNKLQVPAAKLDKFCTWFGRVFKTCQVAVIIYSIVNWNKLETYNKAFFVADILNIGLDLANAATEKVSEGFKTIGSLIGVALNKLPNGDKVLTIMSKIFTADLAEFITTRFSPILMFVAAIKSIYDAVQDAKVGNIGALVVDTISAGIGIGVALGIMLGCACAGPLCLLAGAVLLTLACIKYVFFTPTNDQIFFDKLYSGLKL
ncbi:hypothetical protein DFA_02669 [Cavenderia fasciculata]|uniref:Uncharacterized protein n=1 Tax=Cavenderia fasciculata TaxID=261658 RepID=F4Q015_CACFS|nr:uncharacterized protein DFA_02669 [Cavenderia fasciculata]EGG18929.1 hypothetical protein DFA_02669 [Cavenderia fasciculata]|eukprot:XP_004357391.1 hypothetical protein DFA_02669 [Cavenderia fasciculata]